MTDQNQASERLAKRRVLCADGVVHYRWGQDVSTFKSVDVALEWAEEFSASDRGQRCGPHRVGEPNG